MALTKVIDRIDKRYIAGAIIYGVLVFKSWGWITLTDWWHISVTERLPQLQFAAAAVGFGAAFWAIVAGFFYYLACRLDRFGRRVFLFVAAALCLLVTLAWPGFLDADSVATIADSRTVPYTDWLGTAPVVIGAVLHHIPILGSLALFQTFFLALGVAYALQTLRESEGRTAAYVALGLLAVSLPIYYSTLLVVRETWLAISSLFVAVECVRFIRDKAWLDGRTFGRLLAWAFVAAYFRSESILYVALVLSIGGMRLALLSPSIRTSIEWRPLSWRSFAPAILIVMLTHAVLPIAVRQYPRSAAYDITLWIEPVGEIMSTRSDAIDPETRETIYKYIAPEVFEGDWASKNILEKFWIPREARLIAPPETESERKALNGAAFQAIASNPGMFLSNRVRAFDAANAPNAQIDEVAVQPRQVFVDSPRPQAGIASLERDHTYGGWFNGARRHIEQLFASTETALSGSMQWAIYPDILALVLIAALFPLAPGYSLAALIIFSRIPALFFLMPAAQSKYFFPSDLVVPFLIVGAFVAVWRKASAIRSSLRRRSA